MELTVDASVALDLASKEDLAAHHQRLEKLFPDIPRGWYVRAVATAVVPTGGLVSGNLVAGFVPRPPIGKMWFLQWLAVVQGQAVASAVVANAFASLMVGRSPVGPGAQSQSGTGPVADPGEMVLPGLAVPSNASVPDKTVVRWGEEAYLLIAGSGVGAAGTTYNAVLGVLEVPDVESAYFW